MPSPLIFVQRLKRRWPYTDLYQRRYMALQHVGHLNTLCAHLTQLITNHAPTGEYRFFPHEENISPNMNTCLYAKSTHLENISPQYIPCQQLKSTFHSGHISCNMPHGSNATIWVFCLLWWRYSYSTWSSIAVSPLLVSQHWNLCSGY